MPSRGVFPPIVFTISCMAILTLFVLQNCIDRSMIVPYFPSCDQSWNFFPSFDTWNDAWRSFVNGEWYQHPDPEILIGEYPFISRYVTMLNSCLISVQFIFLFLPAFIHYIVAFQNRISSSPVQYRRLLHFLIPQAISPIWVYRNSVDPFTPSAADAAFNSYLPLRSTLGISFVIM